jgi:tRNA threonylcarbamoyladenosine biosynthesis protein TsaE
MLAQAGDSVESSSESETIAVGESLVAVLPERGILLLRGGMGCGKTALVKGLGRALGVASELIQSPTFTLVHEYEGSRGLLLHIDLYRLAPEEVYDLGFEELIDRDGLKAIEWSERLPPEIVPAGDDVVVLELANLGANRRRIARLSQVSGC